MSEPSTDGRRLWIGAIAIISIVAAATVGWVVGKATDSSAAATVTLVPAGSPGPDPFTQSVAIGDAAEFPTDVRAVITRTRNGFDTDPETRTLVTTGTAPGLYGGSGDTRTCDPAKLVRFLRANPAKARAWSNALGISPNQIAGYVAGLTPVVLTQDTLVTNHGYRHGTANAFNAVLQAGTAVMVDRTGTPRVKCNCGNPLTSPEVFALSDAHTTGQAWTGYAPMSVTIVHPANNTTDLTLVDIETGKTYQQPSGTAGNDNGSSRGAIHQVDFLNRSYPTHQPEEGDDGATCSFGDVTLVNGKAGGESLGAEGYSAEVGYADVTGDGEDEALVALTYYSGSLHSMNTMVFAMRDGNAVELGCVPGDVTSRTEDSRGIVGWFAISNGSVGRADATTYQKVVYVYRGGKLVLQSNETVPIAQFHAETGK
jgi:hypothetical protein